MSYKCSYGDCREKVTGVVDMGLSYQYYCARHSYIKLIKEGHTMKCSFEGCDGIAAIYSNMDGNYYCDNHAATVDVSITDAPITPLNKEEHFMSHCCECSKPAKFRGGFVSTPSGYAKDPEKFYCEDHQVYDIPLVESIASMDIPHNGKLTAIKELREWCMKQWGYRGGLKLAKEFVESIMDEQKAVREQPLTVTFTYEERQKITQWENTTHDDFANDVVELRKLLRLKGIIT